MQAGCICLPRVLAALIFVTETQLDELERVNGNLAAEVDRLETEDGIRLRGLLVKAPST